MKTKLTFLLTSLLLAVGWANVASAQALPGNYADRLGIGEVTSVKATKFVKKMPGVVRHAAPALQGSSVKANAPLRAAYNRPSVVKPKAYYDTLTYSWSNPTNGKSGTDVPSTELATDPYQIYQLLKFVYRDKRFPGPYFNACSSTNQAEDPVYYGGIEGGWNIPFGTASGEVIEPVGDVKITASSYYVNFRSITVYGENNNVLASWTYSGGTSTGTDTNGTFYYYNLPTGWYTMAEDDPESAPYLMRSNAGSSTYNPTYVGWLSWKTPSSIVIPSSLFNGATKVRVVVNASYDSDGGTQTLTVNNDAKTLTTTGTTFANYEWTIGRSASDATETTPTDVLITASNAGIDIASIVVTDATSGSTITSWTANNGATLPANWYANKELNVSNGYAYMTGGGTIRIASERFEGHNSITVTVKARFYSSQASSGSLYICEGNTPYTISSTTARTCTETINFPAKVATDTYLPNEEGYTALLVQVKNNNTIYTEPDDYLGAWEFAAGDSTALINYIGANIKSVQLLTDGLRIGEGENTGTVFNCSGTYNKFFFLGKGRARKKSSGVLASIGLGDTNYKWPSYACEEGPFKFMFEQFSPTGGEEGSQITDFYMEMMDGNVYDVVHDCASVIQNGHQFSMSGNTGTQDYAMSGMNFFIPDYRLKYWRNDSIGITTKSYQPNDGRDMNPYMVGDDNGKTGAAFGQASYFAVNFAQYNPQHAPKVGIYVLTLDADANPCEGYDIDTNHNYVVTLDWTSSLNEMSGHDVPQTYVVYEVISNEDGSTTLDSITTVVGQTHYDFDGMLWPQGEHSQTHNYIIMGYPIDNDHPSFIAWSNEDAIVIPGLNDFLELGLTHYESDFDVPNMKNWYRNFLVVNNDGYVGLTTQGIFEGDSVFNLLRFENTDSTVTKQVAQLKFENQTNGKVKYTINYVDEDGANTQNIEAAKYDLSNMNIPTTGYLSIKHDKDIIIQPNGYDVNFLSITVQAGSYNQTWTSSQSTMPDGWSVSDGSMWVLEDGAYYLEGGGYILIDASKVGNYNTATVTINAYGDAGKTAKISVNGTSKALLNGTENARDYTWTLGSTSGRMAPARATSTDVTFNPVGSSSYYERTQTVDNVTITTTSGDFGFDDYLYLNGTTTISTTDGSVITKIVFNGNSTYYPVSNMSTSTGTYTYSSSNIGTWTGSASSIVFSHSARVYCTSIVVTVSSGGSTGPVEPTVDGVIRMANLRIVDQFAQEIPNTNDHPYRYTYFLKLANGDKESSMVPVPVQHTGAEVQGYYTEKEMLGDTVPENFLQEDVISAQVDMTLSPTSAPYFYTVNSVKDNVPPKADDYNTYVSVLQRRSAGDYQEMQRSAKVLGEDSEASIPNPFMSKIYDPGNHHFFDFREVTGQLTDYLSYVPIIWTNGINRHYFVNDSLHNSYGAPIWKVKRGDVNLTGFVQRQASANGGWNSSVNWWVKNGTDSTAYSLYFVDFTATGVLPECDVDYEPYMFRIWLVDSTESLRNYEWQYNATTGKPVKIIDAGARPGKWFLLDEKMCNGVDDLTFQRTITSNYASNLQFAGPLNNFKPEIVARFYYKKRGTAAPAPNSLRGPLDDNNVGYVVLKGVHNDPSTAIHEIVNTGEVVGQTYYNTLGQSSDRPFEGINIVVTRYSDGTTSTSKVRY